MKYVRALENVGLLEAGECGYMLDSAAVRNLALGKIEVLSEKVTIPPTGEHEYKPPETVAEKITDSDVHHIEKKKAGRPKKKS